MFRVKITSAASAPEHWRESRHTWGGDELKEGQVEWETSRLGDELNGGQKKLDESRKE